MIYDGAGILEPEDVMSFFESIEVGLAENKNFMLSKIHTGIRKGIFTKMESDDRRDILKVLKKNDTKDLSQ